MVARRCLSRDSYSSTDQANDSLSNLSCLWLSVSGLHFAVAHGGRADKKRRLPPQLASSRFLPFTAGRAGRRCIGSGNVYLLAPMMTAPTLHVKERWIHGVSKMMKLEWRGVMNWENRVASSDYCTLTASALCWLAQFRVVPSILSLTFVRAVINTFTV